MAETFTLNEVAALLNTVVSGIRAGGSADDRVFSLPEVAERTGFALRSLELECRRDQIPHTRRGRSLGMTSRQIALLVNRHARAEEFATSYADEMDQARLQSQKNAKRGRAA